MSADKCPVCGSNLRQYGSTVVCESECGFQCDVNNLEKIIEIKSKEQHKHNR